jgi:hypothetical protein
LLERRQTPPNEADVRAAPIRLLRELRTQAACGARDEHHTVFELEPGIATEEGARNRHPPGGPAPSPRY